MPDGPVPRASGDAVPTRQFAAILIVEVLVIGALAWLGAHFG